MDSSITQLIPAFLDERQREAPLVLATIVATHGSTYRKAGAQILITQAGEPIGLLSGGCLESDLVEQARSVFESGAPKMLRYDDSGDDEVFGLGIGCGGSIDVWMTLLDARSNWEPLGTLAEHLERHEPLDYGLVLESMFESLPAGSSVLLDSAGRLSVVPSPALASRPLPQASEMSTTSPASGEGGGEGEARAAVSNVPDAVARWLQTTLADTGGPHRARIDDYGEPRLKVFMGSLVLPRRLLIIGAGPDVKPLVQFAAELTWEVTIADHRAAYAIAERFPGLKRMIVARPDALHAQIDPNAFDAAVIMSHQLTVDRASLEALSRTSVPYVGLLGPAARRQKLLDQVGDAAARLGERLHAPVGFNLGGRDAASVALGIVAEIEAFFHARHGQVTARDAK